MTGVGLMSGSRSDGRPVLGTPPRERNPVRAALTDAFAPFRHLNEGVSRRPDVPLRPAEEGSSSCDGVDCERHAQIVRPGSHTPTRPGSDTSSTTSLSTESSSTPLPDAIPQGGWCVDPGCGPSQIGAYLARQGLAILSVDVSYEMLQHASLLLPDGGHVHADMRALPFANGSIAGIVGFYSLIHIIRTELTTTLAELRRVLTRHGVIAVAVHAAPPGNRADQRMSSTEVLHVEEMLSEPVDLDFHFYSAKSLSAALRSAGFNLVRATERDPYDAQVEAQTPRAYVLARKGS